MKPSRHRTNLRRSLPAPHRVLRFELAPKTMLIALLMIAAVWALVKLLPVVLMFVGTLVLVFTLNPIVGWLETKRIRRKGAIADRVWVGRRTRRAAAFSDDPPLVAQLRGLVEREPEIRGHAVELLQRSSLTNPLADS